MLTTRHGVRVLERADLDAFLALTGRDPVVNVFVDHRARTTNLEPRWLGGEVWGRFAGGELVAACHVGANLVPVQCTPDDARAFAERALTRSRSVSTIVGPHEAVETFWQTVVGLVEPAARAALAAAAPRDQRPATRRAGPRGPPHDRAPTSTSSIPRAWRCTPRRSGSRPRPAGAPSSTGPGSAS